jgi:hypothetical protein
MELTMNITIEFKGDGYVWSPELGVTRRIRDDENISQAKEALAAELRQRSDVTNVTVK